MKKILIILPSNHGTIAQRAFDLYYFLSKRKIAVYIAILNYNPEYNLIFSNQYIFNRKYKSNLIKIIHQIFWITKLKFLIRPDISISTLNSCSIVNVLSFYKDKKIGIFRAPYEQYSKWNSRPIISWICYNLIFSALDKIYCVSDEVSNSLKRNVKLIQRKKILTVYNIFNSQRIYELSRESVNDINFNDCYLISCIGRVEKIKGFDRLLKAFSMINEKLKKMSRIMFIGEIKSYYHETLEPLIYELGLTEYVVFLGYKSNPFPYLAKSNLFVLSSLQEGLPGALIEALILKKPVIATNCSFGVWEILGVESSYIKNLNTIYSAPAGLITSNLSFYNKSLEYIDIENMKIALEKFLNGQQKINYDFSCVNRFMDLSIIDKYII